MADFYLTPEFVREWNRIRSKVDGISGPNVANQKNSISIGPAQTPRAPSIPTERDVHFILTGAAVGGAKYLGTTIKPTGSNIPANTNATVAEIGNTTQGRSVLAILMPEVGQTSHWLTDNGINRTLFRGWLWWVNADGTLVVLFDGEDRVLCAT